MRLPNMYLSRILYSLAVLFISCNQDNSPAVSNAIAASGNTTTLQVPVVDNRQPVTSIKTGNTTPEQLITFARTLTGIGYKYGSASPDAGFDCSGFITYTFNHFGIAVPRSSVDFTHVNHEVSLQNSKPGDLILFTGTDSTVKTVGHMGILTTSAQQGHQFIHATSGKAHGVTETSLNTYYQGRFIKVIRVFEQNDH
jgi:lipoprotein Spr